MAIIPNHMSLVFVDMAKSKKNNPLADNVNHSDTMFTMQDIIESVNFGVESRALGAPAESVTKSTTELSLEIEALKMTIKAMVRVIPNLDAAFNNLEEELNDQIDRQLKDCHHKAEERLEDEHKLKEHEFAMAEAFDLERHKEHEAMMMGAEPLSHEEHMMMMGAPEAIAPPVPEGHFIEGHHILEHEIVLKDEIHPEHFDEHMVHEVIEVPHMIEEGCVDPSLQSELDALKRARAGIAYPVKVFPPDHEGPMFDHCPPGDPCAHVPHFDEVKEIEQHIPEGFEEHHHPLMDGHAAHEGAMIHES